MEPSSLKLTCFELALKCKGTYAKQAESQIVGVQWELIDSRPVLEIAKEIFEWVKPKSCAPSETES